MKILSEKELPSGEYSMDVEFEKNEIDLLVNYAVGDLLSKLLEECEAKEKTFCKGCKYYYRNTLFMIDACYAPENLEDSWYVKNGSRKSSPEIINKNNDCTWYERKQFYTNG